MLVVLIGLTFFVSRSCQQSQIKVSQDEAVATARAEIDFRPDSTTVRLLRQGLKTQPFWIVVLSKFRGERIVRIAQVHIDAKTGEVTEVTVGGGRKDAKKRAGAEP